MVKEDEAAGRASGGVVTPSAQGFSTSMSYSRPTIIEIPIAGLPSSKGFLII